MNILFICTGNTCRSPMAEGYLNSKKLYGVTAQSRGIAADGSPVSENSKTVMAEAGIDISGHVSRQVTDTDIDVCPAPTRRRSRRQAFPPLSSRYWAAEYPTRSAAVPRSTVIAATKSSGR